MPILNVMVYFVNRDLLLERRKGHTLFAPDLTELTQGDIKARFEAWGIAADKGIMQIDEIRKKENLPALEMPFIKLDCRMSCMIQDWEHLHAEYQ